MLMVYALIGIWTSNQFADRRYVLSGLGLALGVTLAYEAGL